MLEVQRAPTNTLLAPIGKNVVLDQAHELYQPGHIGQVCFNTKRLCLADGAEREVDRFGLSGRYSYARAKPRRSEQ